MNFLFFGKLMKSVKKQVGDTKVEDGHTYRLNAKTPMKARWTREDDKYMMEPNVPAKHGMRAQCSGCDRLIRKDEDTPEEYTKRNGYCKECHADGAVQTK